MAAGPRRQPRKDWRREEGSRRSGWSARRPPAVLEIRERLTANDPSNIQWQRDLSISHEKIGGVLQAQGDLAGALTAYRHSLEIRERLAVNDPSNAQGQRDLSVSFYRLAQLHERLEDLTEALRWAEASLAIDEKLASLDPTNAVWQEDVAASRVLVEAFGVDRSDGLRFGGRPSGALPTGTLGSTSRPAAVLPSPREAYRRHSAAPGFCLLPRGFAVGRMRSLGPGLRRGLPPLLLRRLRQRAARRRSGGDRSGAFGAGRPASRVPAPGTTPTLPSCLLLEPDRVPAPLAAFPRASGSLPAAPAIDHLRRIPCSMPLFRAWLCWPWPATPRPP